MTPLRSTLAALATLTVSTGTLPAAPEPAGDALLAEYFRAAVAELGGAPLAAIQTRDDWELRSTELREDLQSMLGLAPWPERTALEPMVTGTVDGGTFVVENLYFQARPGLYVTANFYRPKEVPPGTKLPTVLYLCGHGGEIADGISYGNKTHYRHHGAWFARNGYTCLMLDTIQLGEIQGDHHGTYRLGQWWWNARGYTPAGTEAWNAIRAVDYLTMRPEVDAEKIGVTGRSGGGAYSWWVAALDERIKVAVPVAGITNLKNHVVDGCVEGHCDCMYFINTKRWDFGAVAALVAPRPLLIENTDKDPIFPLDGVVEVYREARRIYELADAGGKIGLHIAEGGHSDTQRLRVGAFQWFERFLKGDDSNTPISDTADMVLTREELKVFPEGGLPADERVTTAQEWFVPEATGRDEPAELLMARLRDEVFAGWPTEDPPLEIGWGNDGAATFASQRPWILPLEVERGGEEVTLVAHDDKSWADRKSRSTTGNPTTIHFAPRGVGPTAWTTDEREHTHIRRRFHLLGQSLDAMQVYDIRRALQAVRAMPEFADRKITLTADGSMATNALFASLFEPPVALLWLVHPTADFRERPIYPAASRVISPPRAARLAADRGHLRLTTGQPNVWQPALEGSNFPVGFTP